MAPIPAVPTKITPQEALQRTIEHREIFHDEMLHLMRQIMSGDMSSVMMADYRLAREERNHWRNYCCGPGDARIFDQGGRGRQEAFGRYCGHRW